jgi:putative transcription factor
VDKSQQKENVFPSLLSFSHRINSIVSAGENKSAHSAGPTNAAKLENETEVFTHATVDRSLSQAIAAARVAKKLSQKQLATAINEKPQVIQQYESGSAIPNPQILLKLDRALGTHLPRPRKK